MVSFCNIFYQIFPKYGQKLIENLEQATEKARLQLTSTPGNLILKLNYIGVLTFKYLQKHGVHFISEEDKTTCVVFSDEQGVSKFTSHLKKLGLTDSGLTHKQILEALEGIESWTSENRKSWIITHKGLPVAEKFNLHVELWPIETSRHFNREKLCETFEQWLLEKQILVLDKVNRDGLLLYVVRVNHLQSQLLFNHANVRKIDLPPETGISFDQLNVDINLLPSVSAPHAGNARICILDDGVNTNHPLLAPAIGESQSYIEGENTENNSGHGTAVAGIALYGDLEACNRSNLWQPELWIYNGKIMSTDDCGNTFFDEKTIENTLMKSVKYFVEECGCRIFNLSIGNTNSPYDGQRMGSIGYILDILSRKYNILFLVSAGNFCGSEDPAVPVESWIDEYPDYLMNEASIIIDPAPALNVLTVGSLAQHNKGYNEQKYSEIHTLSPAKENQPSPFTRHGPSIKGALKPDLMAVGGNLASPIRHEGVQWKKDMRGLGVLTLNHKFVGGCLLAEISGTSLSAPYIAHLAGRLLNNYPEASANLLRAMLVNHANLPKECENTFSQELRDQYKRATATRNRELPREVSGYGKVDEDILYRSTENAVVLMAEDSIKNNTHEFYELPLPASFLRSKRAVREIRVSLAYCPPVRTTRLDYIATNITYRVVKGASLEEVQYHFNNDTKNDAEKLNDSAVPNRTISSAQRDKGTVQPSIFTLKQLKPNEKWFVVVTRKDKEWGMNECLEEEEYALVVTVTDKDNQEAQLYTQIQLRIREQEQVRL